MSKVTTTSSTSTPSFPTFLDLPSSSSPSPSHPNSRSHPLPHHPSISLLPFSITYSGPTDISSLFPIHSSTPTKRSDGTLEEHQEAAFRGRLLISSKVELPKAYEGWVVESRKPMPAPTACASVVGKGEKGGKGVEERVVEKVKMEGGCSSMSGGKVFQKGTRTSPRKKKVVVKYSLDSDEEGEGEGDGQQGMDEQGEDQVMKNGEGAMRTEGEEWLTMMETTQDSIESSSTCTTTTTNGTATNPSTLVSLSTSFSSLPDTPNEPQPETEFEAQVELEPQVELENLSEAPLARDEIHLRPIASFTSIDLWNPDSAADLATDVYARTLGEWTGVAAKVGGWD